MPFVQRILEPKHLSRVSLFNENGTPKVTDEELQAVTNTTLCNALRQLASLALVADDIFKTLGGELRTIYKRSEDVRLKVAVVEEKVANYDPKKVPVPEGDICSFAQTKDHYVSKHPADNNLFKVDTRPDALRQLYEAASKTPVIAMRQLDRWRRDGCRSSKFFICTPVLGAKRRKIRNRVDIDIETRMPQAVTDLRRWTSDEAMGDVTVAPNCASRIAFTLTDGDLTDGTLCSDDEGLDHKLPSPEEQLQVVALRFPAEMVAVDISGKSFDRMSGQRRSLMTGDMLSRTTQDGGDTTKRRTRARRARSRRRNTLAGTDQKEIENALTHGVDATMPSTSSTTNENINNTVPRSKSSDLLRSSSSKRDGSLDIKKSHFNTLKQWGKTQYVKLMNKSGENSNSTSKSKMTSTEDVDDFNLYETITMKRRKDLEKERKTHARNSSISSSEKSIPVSNSNNLLSAMVNTAVKLRDSSLQRRQRRTGVNKDEIHSSSGNWSASSESGRASIGSEITTSTTHPKSTTSAATSLNSLNVPSHAPNSVNSRRRFNVNTSTSGSVTSEGTLTPDIIHDLLEDNGSVYSCDTEGYYTSFHMDSGLKTLKEEDFPSPTSPLQCTSVFSRSGSNNTVLTAENEYELFGKGSTSTTTSSAGTVCTTLRAADSQKSIILGPTVPERKSSLSKSSKSLNKSPDTSLERNFGAEKTGTIKRSPMISSKPTVGAMVHKNGDISPDSGHNTSSSPIESVSSPNGIRSSSDFEFSETSDFEGAERIERIRVKTTINSSRIPSMCVITPSHSDDESSSNSSDKKRNYVNNINNVLETDLDSINGNNVTTRIINTGEKLSKISVDQRTGYATVENATLISSGDKLSMISVDKRTGYATFQSIDQPDGKVLASYSNNKPESYMRAPSPSGGGLIVSEEKATTKITHIRAASPSGGTVSIRDEKLSPRTMVNNVQPMIKASLMPLNNMFGKLKSNIANFASKRDRSKSPGGANNSTLSVEDNLLDSGEYVTIADFRNNNDKFNENISYVNDMVNKNLNSVLSGKIRDTEYVSLNELPTVNENNNVTNTSRDSSLERKRRQGARVMLDAEGKVVYSSDSLRRRKSAHSTFEPGPFIKTTTTPVSSPLLAHRVVQNVRPVTNQFDQKKLGVPNTEFHRPTSPHRGKMVIKASGNQGVEFVRTPSTVVSPGSPKAAPKQPKGAYVHVQATGGALSPKIAAEGVTTPLDFPHSAQGPYPPNLNSEMYHYVETDPYYRQTNPTNLYYQGTDFYQPENLEVRDQYPQERYFSTLPSKKGQFFNLEPPPERSVTPDITRGLQKSPQHRIQQFRSDQNMSYMTQTQFQLPQLGIPVGMPQIDTLKYQQGPYYSGQTTNFHTRGFGNEDLYARSSKSNPNQISLEDLYSRVQKTGPNRPNVYTIQDLYSSPKVSPNDNFEATNEESFKISPIDPIRSSGGLKSSTPAQLKAQTNLESQLNSPKKTTMSHEELYAVIHKSKKKLNIDDDILRASPVTVLNTAKTNIETSLEHPKIEQNIFKNKEVAETGYIGSRQSWSPSKGEYIDFQSDLENISPPTLQNDPKKRQSWAPNDKKPPKKTSTLDFKRLLLSKSGALSGGSRKLSAVEQLKLSKQKMEEQKNLKSETDSNMTILDLSCSPRTLGNRRFLNNPPKSPEKSQQIAKIGAPSKILSPRSQWRFNSPRTDVLSSTILEDSKEDENSSTNSSLEKKPPTETKDSLKFNTENSPALSSQILGKTVSEKVQMTSGKSPKSSNSASDQNTDNNSTKYMTVSQKLQAQRAQFFGGSNSQASGSQNTSENKENLKNLPPTPETAL